jgi:hypothetical protein
MPGRHPAGSKRGVRIYAVIVDFLRLGIANKPDALKPEGNTILLVN